MSGVVLSYEQDLEILAVEFHEAPAHTLWLFLCKFVQSFCNYNAVLNRGEIC